MSGSRAKYSPGPSDCPCWPRRAGSRPFSEMASTLRSAVPWNTTSTSSDRLRRHAATKAACSVEGVDANRNAVLLPLLVVDTLGRR